MLSSAFRGTVRFRQFNRERCTPFSVTRTIFVKRRHSTLRFFGSNMTSASVPRPSASLVLVNRRNEVLMVQRSIGSTSFAGAHVFPGGNYDEAQDDCLEMTAIRETFEETGILLASRLSGGSSVNLNDAQIDEARRDIHANRLTFRSFLSQAGLEPDLKSLLPFTEWTTPPFVKKRFCTKFYLAFLPDTEGIIGPSSGSHIHRLPSPDAPDDLHSSSTEVISAQYLHPRAVLEACAKGELGLMPPQVYILTTLAELITGTNEQSSTVEQREVIARLAKGAFGRMSINPRPLKEGVPEGKSILTYEGDEARGGREGRLHRVVFKPRKGSQIPDEPKLIRNFDIITDIDEALLSKL